MLTPCKGGYICSELALVQPYERCPAGFYCKNGTEQISDAIPCPGGYFCPEQSSTPRPCPPGKYSIQNSDECENCPEGNICLGTNKPYDGSNELSIDEQLEVCPAHHYCPSGRYSPIVCPSGRSVISRYSNATGLIQETDCEICPAGKYCRGGLIAGDCFSGHLCKGGSGTPEPDNLTPESIGQICEKGFYCPAGTTEQKKCPPGLVVERAGARSENECDLCPGGKFCPVSEDESQPTQPRECRPGFYCEYGRNNSDEMVPCPVGTFNPSILANDSSSCQACPPGYYCDTVGIAELSSKSCPEGYYCPGRV